MIRGSSICDEFEPFLRTEIAGLPTVSDLTDAMSQTPQALNTALVQAILNRVRREVDEVQSQIESLQGELIRLREQERLLNELSATVID